MLDSLENLAFSPELAERSERLGDAPINRDGEWVLYWMHHAMRAHDNPALDAAIHCAKTLERPLLVYQGLGGGHAYDSDRSHLFILQAARDVAEALESDGIRYALVSPLESSSPLLELATRAALVIVEHMPVAPFTRWQPHLAERTGTAMLRVDARCIVPMGYLSKAPDRAFRFRDQTREEYRQRIEAGWPDSSRSGLLRPETLPFEPLDIRQLDDAQLAELVAQAEVNHQIGPVQGTPGGSRAGYARWQLFLEQGLASYHRRRNDAAEQWPLGVSRMSAYLHYGMVSPFRIARDARDAGTGGSEKFLEELTIWRELAHHFCAHCNDPDSLSALPQWAQDTLAAHSDDPRRDIYALEDLQRGATQQELWNLAQRSLLVHGELHNNLRMTWAKAIVEWRASPSDALQALLDLNHRYALDGNDPASYGGLLWALGLFDRPFEPEQPVLGTVRPRPVSAHAKRLDLSRYRDHVNRTQGRRQRVAVIGAGIAGLTAARVLHDHNHEVVVIEKSRGPGGRSATRRREPWRFDHGAQYFTARDRQFAEQVKRWSEAGVVAPWRDGIVRLADGSRSNTQTRWRGVDGMNRMTKHLARDLDVRTQHRVQQIVPTPGHGWDLEIENDPQGLRSFDAVIVSAPAPQAAELLREPHSAFSDFASKVEYDPCWAVMATSTGQSTPDWGGAFADGEILDWVQQSTASDGTTLWVAHASTNWSRDNLELDPEHAAKLLAEALRDSVGVAMDVNSAVAHRWRFARVVNPTGDLALFDPDARIGVAGDWLGRSARLESAWQSGTAVAGHLLRALWLEL